MSKLGTSRRLGVPILGVLVLVLFSAASSRADGVTFNNPTGDIGVMHTYTLDGFSIIASAFNDGNLFGKNETIQKGVGLTGDPSGQHEIYAERACSTRRRSETCARVWNRAQPCAEACASARTCLALRQRPQLQTAQLSCSSRPR